MVGRNIVQLNGRCLYGGDRYPNGGIRSVEQKVDKQHGPASSVQDDVALRKWYSVGDSFVGRGIVGVE